MTGSNRCVQWVSGLFLAFVLLQRISVPGMTNVSILLPLAIAWGLAALLAGVVEFDAQRTAAWIVAAAATALITPLQLLFDKAPMVSVTSWALLLVQFLPATLRMVDRREATHKALLANVARMCTWLSSLSLLFMAAQLVTPYTDWVAKFLPRAAILTGFNTSYPLSYGSTLFKSNAWICLEASFLSYILAVGVLAALMSEQQTWRILWLFLGIFTSASGSGFAIIAVGVLAMVILGRGATLRRFLAPLVAVVAIALATPYGRQVLGRVTEVKDSRSSGSVRTVQPYIEMWPHWLADPNAIIFGRGAGSSQRLVSQTGIPGLLNPTLMKVFFDYGLIAGSLLFILIWSLYTRAGDKTMAIAIGFSMWTLQTANVPFVVCVFCVITLWAPGQPLCRGGYGGDAAEDPHKRSASPLSTASPAAPR